MVNLNLKLNSVIPVIRKKSLLCMYVRGDRIIKTVKARC